MERALSHRLILTFNSQGDALGCYETRFWRSVEYSVLAILRTVFTGIGWYKNASGWWLGDLQIEIGLVQPA